MYNNHSTTTKIDYTLIVNDSFDKINFEKKMVSVLNLDNMVVFNKQGAIIKTTILEIITEWGTERLLLNKKRKESMLSELLHKKTILEYKFMFIQAIVTKELNPIQEEKDVIHYIKTRITQEEDMIKMLLDLPIRTLTQEKRNDVEKIILKINNDYQTINNKTEKDIWFEDIERLMM